MRSQPKQLPSGLTEIKIVANRWCVPVSILRDMALDGELTKFNVGIEAYLLDAELTRDRMDDAHARNADTQQRPAALR